MVAKSNKEDVAKHNKSCSDQDTVKEAIQQSLIRSCENNTGITDQKTVKEKTKATILIEKTKKNESGSRKGHTW